MPSAWVEFQIASPEFKESFSLVGIIYIPIGGRVLYTSMDACMGDFSHECDNDNCMA